MCLADPKGGELGGLTVKEMRANEDARGPKGGDCEIPHRLGGE